MSIVIDRQTIGVQRQNLIDSFLKGIPVLPRQSVDQIVIDPHDSLPPQLFGRLPGHVKRLNPVDRFLNSPVGILYAQRCPVAPHLTQGPDMLRRTLPGRSEEHTSELQSRGQLVCRLLLEKKKKS